MTKIQELKEQLEAAKRRMRDEGKDAMKEVFKDFFRKHPGVYSIVWTQYTPYFNDGDPCYFRVSGMECKLSPHSNPPKDVLDEYLRYASVDSSSELSDQLKEALEYNYEETCVVSALKTVSGAGWTNCPNTRDLTPKEKALVDDFMELIDIPYELFEMVFGDHCMVRASASGFEVEEYDHD